MKPSLVLGGGCAVLSMVLSSATLGGALSNAEVQQLATGTSHPVIVIMRNKLSGAAALDDQAPVVSEISRLSPRHVKQFRTVNSLAATVTDAEIERLKANPSVAMVVPDVVIPRAKPQTSATATPGISTSLTPHVIPGACGANG